MTKHSLFSCFLDVFMSYCLEFWGSRAIYNDYKTYYIFESYDQKLIVFALCGCFHELLPIVLGLLGWFRTTVRPNTCLRFMTKNSPFLCFMDIFMSLGFEGDLQWPSDLIHVWELWPKTRRFRALWPCSLAINHSFGILGRFTRTIRLDTCLKVMTKKSSFSCFMAIFMRYCP